MGVDKIGRPVLLQALSPRDDQELKILLYLNMSVFAELRDPGNHTVPVLEIITLRNSWHLIIFPLWGRKWYNPPGGQAIHYLQVACDVLDGLAFMHSHGIAHGVRSVVI